MQVQRYCSVESSEIVAGADRLTSRPWTMLLTGLADRVGLAGAFSQVMGVCVGASRVIIRAGRCGASRAFSATFPPTRRHCLAHDRGDRRLLAVRTARATRACVRELAGAPRRVVLDLDTTLITAHSDEELSAGICKHGFGIHPLLAYEATIKESLAATPEPADSARRRGAAVGAPRPIQWRRGRGRRQPPRAGRTRVTVARTPRA
jgi:hypothetical protein